MQKLFEGVLENAGLLLLTRQEVDMLTQQTLCENGIDRNCFQFSGLLGRQAGRDGKGHKRALKGG